MTTPRVPAYSPNRIGEGKTHGAENRGEEGSQVAVKANYLPNIYQDGQDSSSSGHGRGGQQQAIQALRNGGRAGAVDSSSSKPLFSADSPMRFIGPNAVAASYSPKSRSEENRRHWGDFLPGGSSRAKFLPIDGMAISFDPNDQGINAAVPRARLARNTTVPEDMDSQVRANMYEAHMNVGNPRKDRLQVYNLAGVNLRA